MRTGNLEVSVLAEDEGELPCLGVVDRSSHAALGDVSEGDGNVDLAQRLQVVAADLVQLSELVLLCRMFLEDVDLLLGLWLSSAERPRSGSMVLAQLLDLLLGSPHYHSLPLPEDSLDFFHIPRLENGLKNFVAERPVERLRVFASSSKEWLVLAGIRHGLEQLHQDKPPVAVFVDEEMSNPCRNPEYVSSLDVDGFSPVFQNIANSSVSLSDKDDELGIQVIRNYEGVGIGFQDSKPEVVDAT